MLFSDDLITYQMKLVVWEESMTSYSISKLSTSNDNCIPSFQFWNDCPTGPKMAEGKHTVRIQVASTVKTKYISNIFLFFFALKFKRLIIVNSKTYNTKQNPKSIAFH